MVIAVLVEQAASLRFKKMASMRPFLFDLKVSLGCIASY